MGAIRKTLSVGTLGMISFRSKKEKLQRAEWSLQDEHEARVTAEIRAGRAEKQVKLSRRKRRRQKRDAMLAEVLADLEPKVRSGGRRARKQAKKSMGRAKAGATKAKEAAAPHVENLANKAGEALEHLTAHDS